MIEPARGATSKGVCRLCGAVKSFNNSFEYNTIEAVLTPKQKDGKPKMPDLTVSRRPARWNDGF
jgi:hypothetical protein